MDGILVFEGIELRGMSFWLTASPSILGFRMKTSPVEGRASLKPASFILRYKNLTKARDPSTLQDHRKYI